MTQQPAVTAEIQDGDAHPSAEVSYSIWASTHFQHADEVQAAAAMGPYARWIEQERSGAEAFAERPPLKAFLEHLLIESTVNVFYGPPGGLKTMMIACMLANIAAGIPWPGIDPACPGSPIQFSVTQTRTLLIDYDNGRRPSDDRAQAILRQLGMGPERGRPDFDAFRWLSYPNPRINLSDHASLEQFRAYVTYRGYGVVAVDGLSTVLPAGVKMTEEGARSVLDGLRYVADDTGTAFSLLHHNNKAGTGSPQSVGQDMFGSQMILAAADTAWRVDRVQEKGQRTNKLNLYCTKNRLGPELAPFSMEFYYTPRADDPALMERAWFVSTIPQPPKVEQEQMLVWPVVKHVLQDGEALSQVRLVQAIIDAWDDIHADVECFGVKRLRPIVKALAADDARPLIMQETERGYAFKLL